MPKQTYKIESFHGGLNSNADPRDIKDDEASKLQNVKISKLGRLKTSGLFVTKSVGSATTILNNRGLFSYKSDRKLDGTLSNETFLALYDDNDSAIDISDSDGFDDSTITTFDSDLPVFYVGDGNLRVGDGEFDNAINNKFFGYIEENRFDSLNASLERFEQITVACVADVSRSLDGKYFDIYGADNHKYQVWIDVNNSGTPQPAGSGSYIHSIEVTTITEDMDADEVAEQVAGAINSNSEFTASDDSGTVTITLVDNGEKTDASAGDSGFTVTVVTTGNPLGFAQSNQAILKPTLGHCLMSTPTAGSDTNGVNSSASEYIGNVAEGTGGDVVDIASVNLRVGFQYNSYRGGNAGYYNSITGATKEDDDGSGGILVYPLFGDNNIFIDGASSTASIVLSEASSVTLTEEKSILFGIWIDETNHAKFDDIEFKITETGGSPNTDLVWQFQRDEVKANSWNVFVCNLTNIIEGDATGVGLDTWTLTVTRAGSTPIELDFYFSGIVIGTNPSVSGFQPGEYTFHHTYLYDDEKQESTPFQFIDVDSTYNFNSINIIGGSVLFNFDSYIDPYNAASTPVYTLSKRITGSRLYYKVQENDNYYLIGEIDFVNKGLKWLPEGQEMAYSMANTSNTSGSFLSKASIIKGVSPATANLIDTFKTINGYGGSTGHLDAKFKTAVVHGRRTYIGNIRQPSGSDGKNYPDRMLKSMVNKFDVFPDTIGSVDVAINDGESIIKLEGFADRILQFKEKTLYIINVSENVDFLEDTLVGKGCAFDYHVTKTDFGIAWFNKFGVYFFDGRQVLNLLEKDGRRLISEDDWEAFITDGEDGSADDTDTSSAHIAYIPRSREIFIKNENSDSYMYDFVLRAWIKGSQLFQDFVSNTNFVLDENQDLIYICSSDKRTLKWDINSVPTFSGFIYATKDFDFGQPHVRKKIYKVYVSYTSDGSVVPLYYSVDGDTSLNTVAGAVSGMALNKPKWTVAEYKFNNDAKSCYSIRLQFGIGTPGANFEINDITIVYRLKNIK